MFTHRVTTTSPRRFLVADEVDLGRIIETVLILRELNEVYRLLPQIQMWT
ncbi:hypothetical protein [Cupriavidus sp. M-11]